MISLKIRPLTEKIIYKIVVESVHLIYIFIQKHKKIPDMSGIFYLSSCTRKPLDDLYAMNPIVVAPTVPCRRKHLPHIVAFLGYLSYLKLNVRPSLLYFIQLRAQAFILIFLVFQRVILKLFGLLQLLVYL